MPLIYFLRHGQTDWNANKRFQGQLDVPLNDTGRGQATRNGRTLAQILTNASDFDFVSSPLSRASETMEIVRRELRLDPKAYRTDPRLREIHVGDWQGHWARDIASNPERNRDPWNFVHPGDGGESYALLSARTLAWFAEVDRDTIVTAHGGVMRCLRRHIEGLDEKAAFQLFTPQDQVMRIENGQITWL